MSKSVKRNYLYNVSYQILTILTPVIVTPYTARVFGAANIGIYEYVNSVAGYFILFGLLGITGYGNREIAYNQSNFNERSRVFWEIFFIKSFTMGISTVCFTIFALHSLEYRIYYLIFIFTLLAQIFDITWFFAGIEEFKTIVIRNTVIKLVYLVFLFTFIKTSDDLILMFVYTSVSALLGSLAMWLKLKKYIGKIKFNIKSIPRHFKGSFSYLAPQLATSVYSTLSKILLESITGSTAEVGFYSQADKIVKIPFTIVSTAAGTMFPRMANYHATGNLTVFKSSMNKSLRFVYFMAVPMTLGMFAVAAGFVPWFFGPGFEKVAVIMKIISPTILALGTNYILGGQCLIATNRIKYHTIALTIAAVVNLIVNITLIGSLKSIGAAFAILATEFTVIIVHFYVLRKEVMVKSALKPSYKCFISGAVMFAVIYPLDFVLNISPTSTIIQVLAGITVYFGMMFVLRDEFFLENVEFIINKVKLLLNKNKRKD